MRSVVSVFVEKAGKVLLLKRSDKVGSFKGCWGAVSGFVESEDSSPLFRAKQETIEEIGLNFNGNIIQGRPFSFVDKSSRKWKVFPFKFLTDAYPEVKLDWEHEEFRWVECNPSEFKEPGPIVARLQTSWKRVSFSPDVVADFCSIMQNRTSGAAELAIEALSIFRKHLTPLTTFEDILDMSYSLAQLRPSMNSIQAVLVETLCELEIQKHERFMDLLDRKLHERKRVGESLLNHALEVVRGSVITHSLSGSVASALERAIRKGNLSNVILTESRPLNEGVALARKLASIEGSHSRITLITDAQANLFTRQADMVLLGADCVTADKKIINKVGTEGILMIAQHLKKPVYILCDSAKFIGNRSESIDWEIMDPNELGHDFPDLNVQIRNCYFEAADVGPCCFVTENGLLKPEDLQPVFNKRFNESQIWSRHEQLS